MKASPAGRGRQRRPATRGSREDFILVALEAKERLRRHENAWKGKGLYFFVARRRESLYVRVGLMSPWEFGRDDTNDWNELCRLDWKGDPEAWGFLLWSDREGAYVPWKLSDGRTVGSPEACVDEALWRILNLDRTGTRKGRGEVLEETLRMFREVKGPEDVERISRLLDSVERP